MELETTTAYGLTVTKEEKQKYYEAMGKDKKREARTEKPDTGTGKYDITGGLITAIILINLLAILYISWFKGPFNYYQHGVFSFLIIICTVLFEITRESYHLN